MSLIQTCELTLKTLSPVHIGNGEKIPALFFKKINSDEFGRLKERKFFEIFEKEIGIGRMKAELRKGWNIPTLDKVISNPNIKRNKASFLYLCKFRGVSLQGEINEFIHHPNGEFYVPGSSLKGALRVPILFKVLKAYKNKLNEEVEKELSNLENNRRPSRKKLARLLHGYADDYIRTASSGKLKINTDYMRAFRFFDGKDIGTDIRIVEMVLFKLVPRGNSYTINLDNRKRGFFEALDTQTEIKFTVSVDWQVINMLESEFGKFNSLLPRSLKELIKTADEFYRKVIEEEVKFLENYDKKSLAENVIDFYKKLLSSSKNIIHLGYGGGSNAMSLYLLLRDDLRRRIRNIIKDHQNIPAPLSRRYIVFRKENGEIKAAAPFGWCEVEL